MYTSLAGMRPLTNTAKVAYDVAGLGDFMSEIHQQRSGAPTPTRGWAPHQGSVHKVHRRFTPVHGLSDFDLSSIISSGINAAGDIGKSLIQGHYAPSQNAATQLVGAPATIIPSTQATYLPVSSSGSSKYLMIGGGVAVAALLGFMLMRRRK